MSSEARPPVILVAGTHGLDIEAMERAVADARLEALPWWHPQSPFGRAAVAAGLVLVDDKEPFLWCTEVEGVFGDNAVWYAGGAALRYFAQAKHPAPVSILAHSHGGQVALYAAAQGLAVQTLVTIGTPVRGDMEATATRARRNIRRWLHLYSDADGWQALGEFGDGRLGIYRSMPLATVNILEPGVGHTDLLDPALWTARRWWRLV